MKEAFINIVCTANLGYNYIKWIYKEGFFMDIKRIPFNMNYSFSQKLREVPFNEADIRKGIAYLKKKAISEEDERIAADMYRIIGKYERIVGALESSVRHLQLSIYLYERYHEHEQVFKSSIYLGQTFHWQSNWCKANETFETLLNQLHIKSSLHRYADFLYQQYGKCLLDQQNLSKAHHYFQQSLEIRLKARNDKFIEEANECIKLCLRKLKNS